MVSFSCPYPPAMSALEAGEHLVYSVKAFLITLALKMMAFCLHQTRIRSFDSCAEAYQ